jgi:hypothetical protein
MNGGMNALAMTRYGEAVTSHKTLFSAQMLKRIISPSF